MNRVLLFMRCFRYGTERGHAFVRLYGRSYPVAAEKEVVPMVQLLRAVVVNVVGRLLTDLIKRWFD